MANSTPSEPFFQMDADSANKRRQTTKGRGHRTAMILDARARTDADGAFIGSFNTGLLPKGETEEHHFGIKNPLNRKYAVVCFTHQQAAFCRTRHQATFGAFKTSGQDKRTPHQRAESGKDCPVMWCKGCVAALAAST